MSRRMEIREEETFLIHQLTPSSFRPSLPLPPHPLILPLAVKLFRATSAACLIKFSFLQITIRKRAALLNHITATSYKTVYLLLRRERERERGRCAKRNKGCINDCIIPQSFLCVVVIFYVS